jgi:hypothetical protein
MRRNLLGVVALPFAAALPVTGCAAGANSGSTSVAIVAPSCPGQEPRPAAPEPAGPATLVKPGPVFASICQYRSRPPGSKAGSAPNRRVVLAGPAAAGLAAVIDSAGPLTAQARRCERAADRLPFVQLVTLRYQTGREQAITVTPTDCSLAVFASSGLSRVLGGQVQADLFDYTSVTRHGTGAVTTNVIGMTPGQAAAAATKARFVLSFDGEATDAAAAPWTAVFQVPPAGARDSGPGRDLGVTVAVPPAPACTATQLALSYLGGDPGVGYDFGLIGVRDSSGQPCMLTGPLAVTGLNARGRAVTGTIRPDVTGTAVLSPHETQVTRGYGGRLAGERSGEFIGEVPLYAEYRDGPSAVDNGYCGPLWVVPATWRVVLPDGKALTVANADRSNPSKLVRSGGFVTCRGRMGMVQPASVGWLGG